MENLIQTIKKRIESTQIDSEDKKFLSDYLENLSREQLEFLLHETEQNLEIFVELAQDIKKKKQILKFGSDKEWDKETI